MHSRFVVIGGGLSGLAAGIRLARYNDNVLLLEKHSRVGGLNSYYYRHNRLIETGLHAITNFADRSRKNAPLNKLLRQLKIKYEDLGCHEQAGSEIRFPGTTIRFSNDFQELLDSIHESFPAHVDNFLHLVAFLETIDPFEPTPFQSARKVLSGFLNNSLLVEMLLCPICYYGSSTENDIDFSQFVILFRSIFQEGLFRPQGTIKHLLDLLTSKFIEYGGTLRLAEGVCRIDTDQDRIVSLTLASGETLTCDYIISTIGLDETRALLGHYESVSRQQRLAFIEAVFIIESAARQDLPKNISCLFYNESAEFSFACPAAGSLVDLRSGAVTLPFNFKGLATDSPTIEVRTTHLASFNDWSTVAGSNESYQNAKLSCVNRSLQVAQRMVGKFSDHIVFHDAYTPLTIKRFTGKHDGAIYGCPIKIKDGKIGYQNLFLAGTDQGYLGIVGSMLSGIAIANRHVLMLQSQ